LNRGSESPRRTRGYSLSSLFWYIMSAEAAMRITLAAVGRLKDGPERELFARYADRFDAAGKALALGPWKLIELPEARQPGVAQRKADEAERLVKAVSAAEARIVLDEHGKSLSSDAFAQWLAKIRDGGCQTLGILIGGPDGHGEAVLASATLKLSLGTMTLPHGLAPLHHAGELY